MSLFRRVVAINAGVIALAAVLLAVSPATVSPSLQLAEAVVLAVGAVLMISVNLVLLRRVFGPLEQLTALMARVNPQAPGHSLRMPQSLQLIDKGTIQWFLVGHRQVYECEFVAAANGRE